MVGIIGYMSGGKTYTAVELMLRFLRRDHRVVTNVRLNCRAVTSYLDRPCVIWKQYYYYLSDTPTNWHDLRIDAYDTWPEGSPRGSAEYEQNKVYVFLDEVSSLFDSMASASEGGIKSVATWARHTEKRGQMLYLIMQFPSELHKRLRSHITAYLECTNTSSVKIPLLGVGLPFFLRNMIIRRELMPDLDTAVGSAVWSRLDASVYRCYNTGQIVVGSQIRNFVPVKVPQTSDDQLRIELLTRIMVVLLVMWVVLLCVLRFLTRKGA